MNWKHFNDEEPPVGEWVLCWVGPPGVPAVLAYDNGVWMDEHGNEWFQKDIEQQFWSLIPLPTGEA